MLLRFAPHVLEQTALPELFHIIPIVDNSLGNWIIHLVRRRVRQRVMANVEIQIVNALATAHGARVVATHGDCGRDDVTWLGIAGVTHFGIAVKNSINLERLMRFLDMDFRHVTEMGSIRGFDKLRENGRERERNVPRAIVDDNRGFV